MVNEKDGGGAEIAAAGAFFALAAAEAAVGAAVCPLCIAAVPLFLGVGAYKGLKSKKTAPP